MTDDTSREQFEAHIERTENRKPLLWAAVFASSPSHGQMPERLEGVYFMKDDEKAWTAWRASRAALPAVTERQGLTDEQINAALAAWFGDTGSFNERMRCAIEAGTQGAKA